MLAELASKRAELADCRAGMAGLQSDLQTMARAPRGKRAAARVSELVRSPQAQAVQDDMQNLVAIFSTTFRARADANVVSADADARVAALEAERDAALAEELEAKAALERAEMNVAFSRARDGPGQSEGKGG